MNTTQTTAAQSPEPIEIEEDLAQLLDERAARLIRRRKRANWVIFAFFGLMMASASAWYTSSEVNQRKVADLILNIKSSGKDFKMITSVDKMASQYDKALEKINSRSENINEASVAMGIDPTKMEEDGMETETKEMMGKDSGPTLGERNRLLQQKVGKFVNKPGSASSQPSSANSTNPNHPSFLPAQPSTAAQPAQPTTLHTPAATTPTPAAPARPKPASVPVIVPVPEDAPLIIR